MKQGTKIFLMLLAGTGVAVVTYLLTRRTKNPYKPSPEYDVDPLYKLPEGVAEVSTASIPQEMIDAVRWKHRYFILSRAYADDENIYLVEEHEGFDPLVFLVVPKEAVV